MAFSKITLRKKWWQGNTYKIFDEANCLLAYSDQPSLLSGNLHIYSPQGHLLLELKKEWMSFGAYELIKNQKSVGLITRGWSPRKYFLELSATGIYVLVQKGWGKRIEIFNKEKSNSIGLISASSVSFNEVGVVAQDIDPLFLAACVIVINAIRRSSSS
jgi:hypothetical protein